MKKTFGNLNLATHIFDELDSTSGFLKSKYNVAPRPAFCIARQQTAGYGRKGHAWLSCSSDITFSVLLPFYESPSNLIGLSELVAISLHRVLIYNTTEPIRLKWPNDLYINEKKLAGVLIELLHGSDGLTWLIIGVGLNLSAKPKLSDAYEAGFLEINNPLELVESMVYQLENLSETFTMGLWQQNKPYWAKYDFFQYGDKVALKLNQGIIDAYYRGVSDQGELLVSSSLDIKSNDDVTRYTSAEISLRARLHVTH